METMNTFYNKVIAKILSVTIICTAISILTGWTADVDVLKSISSSFVSMKVVTAFLFMIVGVLGYQITIWDGTFPNFQTGIIGTFTLGALFFSGSAFMAAIGSGPVPFNESGLQDGLNAIYTVRSGSPSLATIFLMALNGLVGLIVIFNTRRAIVRTNIISWIIFVFGALIPFLGYITEYPPLYYFFGGISTGMALNTAVLFLFNAYIIKTYSELKKREFRKLNDISMVIE